MRLFLGRKQFIQSWASGLVSRTSTHRSASDIILRIVRTCVLDPISGATAIQILKQVIKIVATKLLGSSKKSVKAITTVKPGDFVMRLSPMVVGV